MLELIFAAKILAISAGVKLEFAVKVRPPTVAVSPATTGGNDTENCATDEALPDDIVDTFDELSGVLADKVALTPIELIGPVVIPVKVTLLPTPGSVRL